MDLTNKEETIILNWNRICRVCLSDKSVLFPIDQSDGHSELTFYDMINNATGSLISPDDRLPQLICSLCINQLCIAVEFQVKSQTSENILQKLITEKDYYIDLKHDLEFTEVKVECNSPDCFEDQIEDDIIQTDNFKCVDILVDPSSSIKNHNPGENKLAKKKNDESNRITPNHLINNTKITDKRSEENTILDQVHVCPICKTTYDSDIKLLKHKNTHPNTCWKCNIGFCRRIDYDKHLVSHKKLVCTECGKLYKIKSENCTEHGVWYTEEKKHLCTICGKNYNSLSALLVHIRSHTGEKRYACQYCDRKFMYWSSRRLHTRSHHTKEKAYGCQICNKRFLEGKGLRIHMRIHTGERPFPCTECDMKFKDSNTLIRHSYKHTGERKVFCKICNKGFIANYNLKLHMVTHTGVRNYVCLVCSKAFTQAHVLRSHMKKHPDFLESALEN